MYSLGQSPIQRSRSCKLTVRPAPPRPAAHTLAWQGPGRKMPHRPRCFPDSLPQPQLQPPPTAAAAAPTAVPEVTARRKRSGSSRCRCSSGSLAAAAVLLLATAAFPPLVEGGPLSRGAGAAGTDPFFAGGGSCRRRGLAKNATRGCFVLCVTPSSATTTGSDGCSSSRRGGSGGDRGHCGGGGLAATSSSIRRTRAGVVASQSLLAGVFLNRKSLEWRVADAAAGGGCGALGSSRGGGDDVGAGKNGSGGGGARVLECAAKDQDGGKASRVRSRVRQIVNRMRGGRSPAAALAARPATAVAAAGSDVIYDMEEVCVCVLVFYQDPVGNRLAKETRFSEWSQESHAHTQVVIGYK